MRKWKLQTRKKVDVEMDPTMFIKQQVDNKKWETDRHFSSLVYGKTRVQIGFIQKLPFLLNEKPTMDRGIHSSLIPNKFSVNDSK